MKVVVSTSASVRIDAALKFLSGRSPASEVVIVGASRGAADDLARTVAVGGGASFGLTRFSLTELAAAAAAAAGTRRIPGTASGAQARAARAVFDAAGENELRYFAPVAATPGFPKALARTVHELRLAGITHDQLLDASRGDDLRETRGAGTDDHNGFPASDIGRLLARIEAQLDEAMVDDRAALFGRAADACKSGAFRWTGLPLILLDVPLDSEAERALVAELVSRASDALATVPEGDRAALEALTALGGDVEAHRENGTSDLPTLRRHIFQIEVPPVRDRTGEVRLFSAPGEGREAVEIVRRVLDEAQRGVRFDEMAVFLRAPQHHVSLLHHACARGGVPVYFDRGTERPDPAGRAFLALLSCACEGLSARRFDEYLSLGQVPPVGAAPKPSADDPPLTPTVEGDDRSASLSGEVPDADPGSATAPEPVDSDDEAVVAGTLRSPWKWEELIVESAVVGGRTRADGRARWRRRLDGLAADFRYRIGELRREEPESPRMAKFERDLRNLAHLKAFALPIVDRLAEWPEQAAWRDWLTRFSSLATIALARPARVLQTLVDLRPMADIGPVRLDEARDVLRDRLVALEWDPPARRYGRLFVGTPHQARGRTFRVVFVPGLAERIVPQRPREDPLLLDDRRLSLDKRLIRQEDRSAAERLLLRIAIGAATERLYLSYPRLDVAETRARVPSFYALDVMRAMTGRVPDHRALASEAADEGGARLGWPAPQNPDRAIDDLEHDLAVLKPLLESRDRASLKGHAHYLLNLNDSLRRSVISRWARARPAWSPSDGLTKVTPGIEAALAGQRLTKRPYSLSALQRFAACPYQFFLSAIHRLEPWDEPQPLVRMDPLTRGSLYHKAQAEFFRAMQKAGRLPIRAADVPAAADVLDGVLNRVADDYAEDLAPAIDRVWKDEIGDLRRDLAIWLQRIAADGDWLPSYFEFSFGLNDEGRDPHSLADPVTIDRGFVLRGSVDLIERHRDLDILRVTDHKTGRSRATSDLIVGGGAVLQPVLYSVAVERALGKKVANGRLFYSTTVGGFVEYPIDLTAYNREQGLQVLAAIDRAVETGFLPAAPHDRACSWCDFRPVCGPREEERVAHKNREPLADLEAVRAMR